MKKEKMQPIYDLMPEGWREAAREQKALKRSRNIQTPEELLRLNILYQTSGESYGLTAALTQISDNQKNLTKTAVQKRITNSGSWLRWICEHLSRQEGFLVEPPEWLKKYRVCLVDASNYAKQGSKRADFRVHSMIELFTLNAAELHFTGAEEGEKLTRFTSIRENDLVIADRAYGTIRSMSYALSKGAHFVLRLKAEGFRLYDEDGNIFPLTERLQKEWEPGKELTFRLFFKEGKKAVPVRVCAVGKTPEEVKKSQRNTKKSNHGRRAASPLQSIWNQYIVVITSLPEEISTHQVLELYRMRWQIELVFKRFKSIMNSGSFSARKKEAVEA